MFFGGILRTKSSSRRSPEWMLALFKDTALATLVFSMLVSSAMATFLFLGLDSSRLVALMAVVSGFIAVYFLFRSNTIIWVLGSLAGTLLGILPSFLADFSWDGRTYHRSIIEGLRNGNLILGVQQNHPHHSPWIEGYPKLPHLYNLSWSELTGNFSAGKHLDVILIVTVFAFTLHYFKHQRNAWLIATALSFHPVAFYQLESFYIDGILAMSGTLLFLSVARIWGKSGIDHETATLFVVSAFLLGGSKFTGGLHVVIAVTFVALLLLLRHKRMGYPSLRENMKSLLLVCFLIPSVLNPYLTNLLNGRHLLYPILGTDIGPNVLSSQASAEFNALSPHIQLLVSISSQPSNVREGLPENHEFLNGFPESLAVFGAVDVRFGGWGPLFIFMAMVAFIFLLLSSSRYIGIDKTSTVLLLLFLVVTLAMPEGWWARLNPGLYSLVALYLALVIGNGLHERDLGRHVRKPATWVLSATLLANALLPIYGVIVHSERELTTMNKIIENLHQDHGPTDLLLFSDKFIFVEIIQKYSLPLSQISSDSSFGNCDSYNRATICALP